MQEWKPKFGLIFRSPFFHNLVHGLVNDAATIFDELLIRHHFPRIEVALQDHPYLTRSIHKFRGFHG